MKSRKHFAVGTICQLEDHACRLVRGLESVSGEKRKREKKRKRNKERERLDASALQVFGRNTAIPNMLPDK